ncbi:Uracil-DNA glycosylase OS=Streptomyces cyaneofuscatus OX=66883 GN=ung PE=3 SV=1 [Streptomyces cyaneofuscatus]
MAARPLKEIIEPGWADALEPVAERIAAMGDFLRAEIAAGRTYLPSGAHVLRAFQQPFEEVRVLVVGQDPYPTPGHAIGLSFAVAPDVRPLPGSLENIFRELHGDLGIAPAVQRRPHAVDPAGGAAAQQGADHRAQAAGRPPGQGVEEVTEQAIKALVAGAPPSSRSCGRDARNLRPLLGDYPAIESAHPSPMSADRGFFGSRPFSRVNELLERQGAQPVDWRLP